MSEMPLGLTIVSKRGAAARCGLAFVYLLLLLLLNPFLIHHDLAGGQTQHSDKDICSWLDHAAGSSLHSALPVLPVTDAICLVKVWPSPILLSRDSHSDPVRGPPVGA